MTAYHNLTMRYKCLSIVQITFLSLLCLYCQKRDKKIQQNALQLLLYEKKRLLFHVKYLVVAVAYVYCVVHNNRIVLLFSSVLRSQPMALASKHF